MKRKLRQRQRSISAPRLHISRQLAWPVKVAMLCLLVALATGVAVWTYETSRGGGSEQVLDASAFDEIKKELLEVSVERDLLSTAVNASESQLNIERAAQKQLAVQVSTLEAENVRLKEELAFFETLLPANTGTQPLTIRRLRAEILGMSQLRYRFLVMQGTKVNKDFAGSLQLAVTVVQDGKNAMIVFPPKNAADSERANYALSFRHYQYVDGTLSVPEGAVIKAVQVRVLEKGQIRTQESVNL